MARARDSLARRLTVLNVLVSAAAVVLACFAFLAYEVNSFRLNIMGDLSIQSQIIGSNSASTLIFNDKASAEKTLSALEASPHVTFAGIYQPNGQFFAGYWRDLQGEGPIPPAATGLTSEIHWFANCLHHVRPARTDQSSRDVRDDIDRDSGAIPDRRASRVQHCPEKDFSARDPAC
jgi:hypothetical protein